MMTVTIITPGRCYFTVNIVSFRKRFNMTNREALVSAVAFIVSIFAGIGLAAKFGAAAIRYLVINLYHLIFPRKDQHLNKPS